MESKEPKEHLTNEMISKRFKNQFDLVNYSIKLAENAIRSGREPAVKMDTQNMAILILAEIATNQDKFVEIFTEPKEIPRESSREETSRRGSHKEDAGSGKFSERKKARKILSS